MDDRAGTVGTSRTTSNLGLKMRQRNGRKPDKAKTKQLMTRWKCLRKAAKKRSKFTGNMMKTAKNSKTIQEPKMNFFHLFFAKIRLWLNTNSSDRSPPPPLLNALEKFGVVE